METSNKLTGEQLSLWTSSAADIPANHSAQQESDKEQTIQDTCGLGCEQPLASYDPDTQSWRTSEDISLWGDYKLLESLPKSGMTRSGVLYQQPEWVRPIDVSESSLWPTPLTNDNKAGIKKANPNLVDAVMMRPNLGEPAPTTQEFKEHRMFPTPRSSSAMAEDLDVVRERLENGKQYKSRLEEAIAMWPTPTAVNRPMEGNVRMYRAKVQAGEMTEEEAEAILGKSVWEAQGKIPAMWPTPTASSWGNEGSRKMLDRRIKSGDITEDEKRRMTAGNGGKLNPMWVEWLMGFPVGWTDLKD